MAKKRKPPLMAICGRPNVGKSTLFNRIVGRQHAIVHSEEGITRDRTYGKANWMGREFRLVDTGGIVEDPIDPVVQKMQEQVRMALEEAHVAVFVVDGQQPLTRVDHELAESLFRLGKPVVLAVNKLDNARLADRYLTDFYELGFSELVAISGTHNIGVDQLLDTVFSHFPPAPEPAPEEVVATVPDGDEDGDGESSEEDAKPEAPKVTRVAVIGKPNAGKSSFVNAILNEERSIVDDRPGTTRDAIDVEFQYRGREYVLVDTAGMRKKAGIDTEVEYYSVTRSLRAVRGADVCLVMLDATDGITEQDKRILSYASENGVAMVIVFTKWDLIENKEARLKSLKDEIDLKAPFIKFVPTVTVSNVTRQRLFKTFDLIDEVAAQARRRISTAELNKVFEIIKAHPTASAQRGHEAKVIYATQTGIQPTMFVLFVNQKRLFHFSYVRFIENQLRERFGFKGVPLRLELREGKGTPKRK